MKINLFAWEKIRKKFFRKINNKLWRYYNYENKTAKADKIIFYRRIRNGLNKSKNQMKTLVQTIFPRIALYKVMSKDGFSEEDVYHFTAIYFLKLCA